MLGFSLCISSASWRRRRERGLTFNSLCGIFLYASNIILGVIKNGSLKLSIPFVGFFSMHLTIHNHPTTSTPNTFNSLCGIFLYASYPDQYGKPAYYKILFQFPLWDFSLCIVLKAMIDEIRAGAFNSLCGIFLYAS